MKNIFCTVFTQIFLIFVIQAQPTKPVPPQTPGQQEKRIEYRVEGSEEDRHENSSVSISESDDRYKMTARFVDYKTDQLKLIIINRMGSPSSTENDKHIWIKKEGRLELVSCKLIPGRLRVQLDKIESSDEYYNLVKDMCHDLKQEISGSSHTDHATLRKDVARQELERAQQDLERAQQDLERAQRDMERAQQHIERLDRN